MAIERAGRADEAQLLALIQEFYAIDGHDYDESRVRAALGPLLLDDRYGQVWLLTDDDEPAEAAAGYAIVTWGWSLESGGLDCILDEIYVRERGQGRGGEAIEQVMAAAAAAGAAAMFLETEAPNERARRFYQRHGFAVQDSVWLSRPLSGA